MSIITQKTQQTKYKTLRFVRPCAKISVLIYSKQRHRPRTHGRVNATSPGSRQLIVANGLLFSAAFAYIAVDIYESAGLLAASQQLVRAVNAVTLQSPSLVSELSLSNSLK